MAHRRVLMMVDNKVVGDARVLKTAATVARLGHEVMALGRRPRDPEEIPDFGFEIKLVKMRRRHRNRDALTYVGRAPLAYRSVAQAETAMAKGSNPWRRLRLRRREAAMARTVARAQAATAAAPDTDPQHLLGMDPLWRNLQPVLTDYEDAYRPVIERFRPDIIHAHDFRTIGIAVRAAQATPASRRPKVVYDAHEFVPGLEEETPEFLAGNSFYEASHIRLADRIVTVSDPLAGLLREHHRLDRTPAVTLNAPEAEARAFDASFTGDVRNECGVGPDVPLVVYSGGVAPRRGLGAVVAGLAFVPGVHLGIIANRDEAGRALITDSARDHGVGDRVHLLDFVPRLRIIQHLATADVAVHPLIHLPNHEIALPNKFFDYVFAGLPMIVSDVAHLSDVVNSQGLGRSFVAQDPAAFAAALREVVADLPSYRKAVADCPLRPGWTWEAQEPVLAEVYDELTGRGAED